MRRKNLLLLLLILPILSKAAYSQKLNYNIESENATIYTIEKGKSHMRTGIFQHRSSATGRSGSNQYIEYINGRNDFDSRDNYEGYRGDMQGFVLGTTSTFKRTPDSTGIVGVTFSYINSQVDYENSSKGDETDTYNFNAYVAKEYLGYVAMGYGGFSLGDTDNSGDRDTAVLGMEIGKIQPLFSGYLYPYASVTGMRTFSKEYSANDTIYNKNNETKYNYRIGSEYKIEYNRYFAKVYAEYVGNTTNTNNQIRIETAGVNEYQGLFSLDKDSIRYGALIGYKLDDTMTLTLEGTQVKSSNDSMLVGGVKISHKF